MKIVAIGDTHGRAVWKEMVAKEPDADKIVFIGDYVDSFNVPPKDQLVNLIDILEFKRKNPDKVVLILGNHDYHYLPGVSDRYSGYQNTNIGEQISWHLSEAMKEGLLHVTYLKDKYLFSHAGVTNTWLKKTSYTLDNDKVLDQDDLKLLAFSEEDKTGFGNHPSQSPIWVRPDSFIPDALLKYVQVVGHSRTPNIAYYEGEHPTRAVLLDCLDTVNEYLVVEDNVPRTETI